MARLAAGDVARDLADVAHVDADRRQDRAQTDAAHQSLLERRHARDAAGTGDAGDSVPWAHLHDEFRFSRATARHRMLRRSRALDCARAEDRSRVLSVGYAGVARVGHRGSYLD